MDQFHSNPKLYKVYRMTNLDTKLRRGTLNKKKKDMQAFSMS